MTAVERLQGFLKAHAERTQGGNPATEEEFKLEFEKIAQDSMAENASATLNILMIKSAQDAAPKERKRRKRKTISAPGSANEFMDGDDGAQEDWRAEGADEDEEGEEETPAEEIAKLTERLAAMEKFQSAAGAVMESMDGDAILTTRIVKKKEAQARSWHAEIQALLEKLTGNDIKEETLC